MTRAKREVPEPMASLFHGMADLTEGLLRVVSIDKSGLVRMTHLEGRGDGPGNVLRSFHISSPGGDAARLGLVEVRAVGQPPVLVSRVPSAVLAVALR
jgi:hypothetical protein